MTSIKPKIIWNLPRIEYEPLAAIRENRPVALITDDEHWERIKSMVNLPIVVQSEPERTDEEFINFLAENVPALVEVVYVVGSGDQLTVGKVVAHKNNLPLVVIPTELDTDQLLEPNAEILQGGVLKVIETGPAERVIIDWDVIKAADPHIRAGVVADMLAIVTGLLDWRHAAKLKRNRPDQAFIPWAAGVAASLASQTIKIADAIGRGEVEALRALLDLTSVSVQLANQLGHARQQEGTEHYFAALLDKHGIKAQHAECLGPGILLTSALHNQDPTALRDALLKSGIRLDQLRSADVQLAVNELPHFARENNLPYSIAHEIDPFSDHVLQALRVAGLSDATGGWVIEDTRSLRPQTGSTGAMPPMQQGGTGAMPPQQMGDTAGYQQAPQGDTGGMPPMQQPPTLG